jgi:RNA polymerase sigma factor (sigma-70 family)
MSDRQAYRHSLRHLLGLLSEKQAAALRLQLQGLPYAEIGRRLGVSEWTARKRVHDAREALRAALGDGLDDLVPRQRGW